MKKFLSLVSGRGALFLTVSTASAQNATLTGRLAMGPAHRSPGRVVTAKSPQTGAGTRHY